MADVWATRNGVWSDPTLWSTGTVPTPEDVVFPNNRTVIVNVSGGLFGTIQRPWVVDRIRNVAPLPPTVVAGGGFRLGDGVYLSAGFIDGGSSLITLISAAPATSNLMFVEAVVGTGGGTVIQVSNTGTLNITGHVRGSYSVTGGETNTVCLVIGSNGTVNLSGSITAGDGRGTHGCQVDSGVLNLLGPVLGQRERSPLASHDFPRGLIINNGTVSVSGNVEGGRTVTGNAAGILISAGTLTVIGTVSGGLNGDNRFPGPGILINGTGIANVFGNTHGGFMDINNIVQNSIGGAPGIRVQQNGSLNLFGNAIGGFGSGIFGQPNGVDVGTTGTVFISGYVMGINVPGVEVRSDNTGAVYIKRVIGSPGGPTKLNSGFAASLSNSQNGLVFVEQVEFGEQGTTPISGPVFFIPTEDNALNMITQFPELARVPFFVSFNKPGIFPAEGDVRKGTIYGLGDFTGTMAVPSPTAVQFDVPVDDTKGELFLRPENFWEIQRSAITNPTTIGYRLKNVATIGAAGQLLGSFNVEGLSGYNLP